MVAATFLGQAVVAQTVSVEGQVRHKTNVPIAGASVLFESPGGVHRRSRTNKAGAYAVHNLPAAVYSVRVEARGFLPYEARSLTISETRNVHLDFKLDLAPVKQEIVVPSGEKPLSIEPESSASEILLRGSGLSGLPDDPSDFAAAVQALAGPSALGPSDPQLFVNGFINDQMPPKETVREIHINENPFSAENDRPATNRIEAVTKAGGRQFHGESYLNFDAGWWDSANPFTRPAPPNPSKLYGGNLSGPLGLHASFFVPVEHATLDFKNAVNATVLDSSFRPVPLIENVPDVEKRLLISPQVDVTLNKANTVMVRYSSSSYSLPSEGVGGTTLPEAGYKTSNRGQTVQASETAVLSSRSVDETKLQYVRTNLAYNAATATPAIAVDQAFTSGSSTSALSSLHQNQWELQNNLSNVLGHHSLRMGIRLRGEIDTESLEKNFAGTFSFSSGSGPALGPDNTPLLDAQGAMTTVPLTGLERYRRTMLFEQQGLSPSAIRSLGGGASSFSIDTGDPRANVRQYDTGIYVQDDWHLRPNLLLGAGLRYEKQTNLHDPFNVGPRLSFAWAPSKAKDPHTVLRGGLGLFYDRVDATLVLQTRHSQHPHWHDSTSDPALLDLFPVALPASSLAASAIPADTLDLGPNTKAPTTLQETLSLEQQFPGKTRLSVSYTEARTFRDLLLVDTTPFQQGSPRSLTADSSGLLTQRQMKVEVSNRFSKRLSLTSDYVLNFATSDTDGTKNPAANPDELSYELGPSVKDIRNNFTLTGSWDAPWGIRLSPFVVASSSRPFNIITGQYQDPDFPYTGRPVVASDPTQPDVIVTRYGAFQLDPLPGQTAIARNFGRGPAFFSASFRLSKTFAFGEPAEGGQTDDKGSSKANEHHYSLVVSAQAVNITNHLNAGVPEGNLSSANFGQSSALAPGFNFGGGAAVYPKQLEANRRLELQIRFVF